MTLQTRQQFYIPANRYHDVTSAGTFAINATGMEYGVVFRVPKTGNIQTVVFRTGTVTSAQTLTASIYTVDTTTGAPTAVAYGSMVKGTSASPTASTWFTVTLGTVATATKGDIVAAVLEWSGTAGNLQIASQGATPANMKFPYTATFNGTTWSKVVDTSMIAVGYDDGTYENIGTVPAFVVSTNYNSGSTPDEVAMKFTLPFPTRIKGAWFQGGPAVAGADYQVVLYDSNGTSVLTSATMDGDIVQATTAGYIEVYFDTATALTANTAYRVSLLPTTANNFTYRKMTVTAAAVMDSLDGGQNFMLSTRTNAGAWTDSAVDRPLMGLILDQADDATAVGGGTGFFIQ